MSPQIAIFHVNTVPSAAFEDFRRTTASPEVDVQVIAVDPPGPMAAFEWLLPTVVVGFVASSYFGGFLQEMGKEHYLLVKEQFKKLYVEVAGPEVPAVKLVGCGGNFKEKLPYSLYFSLVGEGPNDFRFKLLLKQPIDQDEYGRCVAVFLDFLADLNTGKLGEASQKRFEALVPMGQTILVVWDSEVDDVVPINPRTGELLR